MNSLGGIAAASQLGRVQFLDCIERVKGYKKSFDYFLWIEKGGERVEYEG